MRFLEHADGKKRRRNEETQDKYSGGRILRKEKMEKGKMKIYWKEDMKVGNTIGKEGKYLEGKE